MSEHNLMHLLTLARRGSVNGGGSTAEKQARKIVLCILTNAVGLDGSAVEGVADLIHMVQSSPQDGRAAVRRAIR